MKRFLFSILAIFLICSCSLNLYNSDKDIKYINSILNNYNMDESLSLKNYLVNELNTGILLNGNTYSFLYNDYLFTITDNDIKKEEYIYEEAYTSLEELASADLNINDIAYVKTNTFYSKYIITNKTDLGIMLNNGKYAQVCPINGILSFEALNPYRDGINDDSTLFNIVFNNSQKYGINYLILDNGSYLCQNRLNIDSNNGFTIIGNNSNIIVDDKYNDEKYNEFFFSITYSNDILISKINILYEMKRAINGIKTQLSVHSSNNIEIVDSNFNIPNDTLLLDSKDREFTNMDLYTNWHNVIINRCIFNNICDSNAGGSLWIRDFHGLGSSDVKVLNSSFYKIAHDEILAVFMGSIENVLIKNNKFIVPDDLESSSVMNFTLGSNSSSKADNIIFENNEIDTSSTGGLFWTNGTNIIIRNNKIKAHLSKKSTNNYRLFEGKKDRYITLIENNEIFIDSYLDDYSFQVHLFNNVNEVINNTISSNLKLTDVFINTNTIRNNEIVLNCNTDFLSYNVNEFNSNKVAINDKIGSIFRYYKNEFSDNKSIINNEFNYRFDELESESYFIMLNDLKMNGYQVIIKNNTLYSNIINEKSRLLFFAPIDDNIQVSSFINNNINGYNYSNNYLKNIIINEGE